MQFSQIPWPRAMPPKFSSCVLCSMVLIGLVAVGCVGQPSDASYESSKLVITGSSTIAPLVSEIVQRFESEHPGVRLDVQTGGSSRGLSDVRSGLADIGMVSRSPKLSEDDLNWHAVAKDGLALVVHADNLIDALDEQQVRDIFTGATSDWNELKPSSQAPQARPITVVNKAAGRSTLEVFLAHFELASGDIDADVVIGDNQQGIKTVIGNPDAIAYVSIGAAEYEVIAGAPLRLLELSGQEASTEAVRAGTYPIARTLHLVTRGDVVSSLAEEFLAYCRSGAVDDLIEGQYFVPFGASLSQQAATK